MENMEHQQKPDAKRHVTNLLIVLALIVVLGICSYAIYTINLTKHTANYTAVPVATTPTTTVPSTTTPITKTDPNDLTVTWQKPEKLADLGLISTTMGTKTTYYKVGTAAQGTLILAVATPEGPGGTNKYYYLHAANVYKLLTKISDAKTHQDASEFLISVDESTLTISELVPDPSFIVGSTKFTRLTHLDLDPVLMGYTTDTYRTTDKKVGTTKWGDLYQATYQYTSAQADNPFHAYSIYYVVLADTTKYTFEPRPTFMKDDGTMDIPWVDATAKTVNFGKQRANGCGLGASATPIGTAELAKLTHDAVATTPNGKSLYILTDPTNAYVKSVYDSYASSHTGTTKTITDFINGYGLLLWTDDYGSVQVFQNTDYQPAVECGKPVIYLYPPKEMQVSVKVGAQITKSEPTYNNGWTVTAEPDGTLKSGGKQYDSLFWEGFGFGMYPQITSGTVVAKADVQKTISTQLAYIGLNAKEISDFESFWLPKMPSTPYVRLSWLQNKAMDQLAPLYITPKPDSVIRVFLDFSGQSTIKSALSQQTLQKMPRNGFAAVEWGGLIMGSDTKKTQN